MYFLNVNKLKFKHKYCTKSQKTDIYIYISKCKTEFYEQNPFNTGIKLVIKLDLDINLFINLRMYKKIITEKINQIIS